MPNEFVARNGVIAQNNSIVSGSLIITQGITGSLFGTASWANNASTSSYILNAVSSSFASTASFVQNAQSASYVLNAVSSSFATTASFALNAQAFPFTGSAQITGSLNVTGSLGINNNIYNAQIRFAGLDNTPQSLDLVYPTNGALRFGVSGGDGPQFQGWGGTEPNFTGQMFFDYGSFTRTVAPRAAYWRNMNNGTITNVMVLDANNNVGIGTSSPLFRLDVAGSGRFTNGLTVTGSLNAPNITGSLQGTSSWAVSASWAPSTGGGSSVIAATGSSLYSTTPAAGIPNTDPGSTAILLGDGAGSNSTGAINSNFFGYQAGQNANNAGTSNFFGYQAGRNATSASFSNFFGPQAGNSATNTSGSNFLGARAGQSAVNAHNSNFLGQWAGTQAWSSSFSTFIGYKAGSNFTNFGVGSSGVGPNNIIIGTNITLADNRRDSINIGGIIFGTGSYSIATGYAINSFSGSVGNGRIGINVVNPIYTLDVSGSGNYTNGLTVTGSTIIGAGATAASSILQVNSTSQGFLPPRMTTAFRQGIGSPAQGLHVYDTDLLSLQIYNGTNWQGVIIPNVNSNVLIGTTTDSGFRLDVSGSGVSGSLRISPDLQATTTAQSAILVTGSIRQAQTASNQIYGMNIAPTMIFTTGSQTNTAFRVAPTFSGSAALTSSQQNIIADFGATSVGSQFVVNDITSGSIYMVNDVSGLPIIEALSDWTVNMYNFPTRVFQKTGSSIIMSSSLTVVTGSGIEFQVTNTGVKIGNLSTDVHQVTGSLNVTGSITGSLFGTASFATTASFALNAFPFTGSARITGSSTLIGNQTITGSLLVTQSYISTVDYIDFTTTSTPTHLEGRTHWDTDTKTLQLDTDVSNFSIETGHQNVIRGRNVNNFTLTKGSIVYISGESGNRPTFATASWELDSSSATTLGFVAENIISNQTGYVITAGIIRGIDTNAFAPGTQLYLSASGQYTSTVPISPLHEVRLGKTITQATQGTIYVDIMNGYEIGELHDVSASVYQTGDLLVYNSGSKVWTNSKTLSGSYTITDSLTVTGSLAISDVLVLPYQNPLPSGKPTGSIATSGSGATFIGLFLYDGTSWIKLSV